MKNRTVQYVVWIIGSVILMGVAFALVFTQVVRVQSGIGIGIFWLWTGFLMMMGWNPEWRQWDRWEQQTYGLAFVVMGGIWSALNFTSLTNVWWGLFLVFVPPALIALIGRVWYVEHMRSRDWKRQNKTNINIEKER